MAMACRFAVMALCVLIGGKLMAGQALARQALAFDIEAHRGGRALFPENTLVAFANALSIGVDTLELDIGVTQDGAIVISHERRLNPDLALGPDGNYVAAPGTPFVQLTLDEVKQFDVGRIRPGSRYAAQFPDQKPVPGTKIPTLKELIGLVRKSGDSHVRLNIETKIDPDHSDESPEPERFVALLLELLRAEDFESRVMVQSFDWRIGTEAGAKDSNRLSDCASRSGADRFPGQGVGMECGLQSFRSRKVASTHRQGRRRRDLVAAFRRRHAGTDSGIARARPSGRGLDREQAGRHEAADRDGRGRHHFRFSRPAAQGGRRKRHRPAGGIESCALSPVDTRRSSYDHVR
jgi:Glycerophosphoryl diester phosphodiesterase family